MHGVVPEDDQRVLAGADEDDGQRVQPRQMLTQEHRRGDRQPLLGDGEQGADRVDAREFADELRREAVRDLADIVMRMQAQA